VQDLVCRRSRGILLVLDTEELLQDAISIRIVVIEKITETRTVKVLRCRRHAVAVNLPEVYENSRNLPCNATQHFQDLFGRNKLLLPQVALHNPVEITRRKAAVASDAFLAAALGAHASLCAGQGELQTET
jgi:hypothetical protein